MGSTIDEFLEAPESPPPVVEWVLKRQLAVQNLVNRGFDGDEIVALGNLGQRALKKIMSVYVLDDNEWTAFTAEVGEIQAVGYREAAAENRQTDNETDPDAAGSPDSAPSQDITSCICPYCGAAGLDAFPAHFSAHLQEIFGGVNEKKSLQYVASCGFCPPPDLYKECESRTQAMVFINFEELSIHVQKDHTGEGTLGIWVTDWAIRHLLCDDLIAENYRTEIKAREKNTPIDSENYCVQLYWDHSSQIVGLMGELAQLVPKVGQFQSGYIPPELSTEMDQFLNKLYGLAKTITQPIRASTEQKFLPQGSAQSDTSSHAKPACAHGTA